MKRYQLVYKRILFVCGLSISHIHALSQTENIDSLKVLSTNASEKEKSEILTELTAKYISIYKYSEALKYANQGLVKVRQLSDTPRLIKLYRLKAMTFRKLNDVDSSIILLQQILPIAKMKNDIEEIKFTLNGLGLSYLSMAAYDKALKYYFELFDYPLESG